MINKVIFQWKAVYMETCTYGLEAGTGKPTAEMRKGVPCRAYRSDSGRQVRSRNLSQDLRSKPVLTPQLLDCSMWRRRSRKPTSTSGRRGSDRGRSNPHSNQVHLRARERA